MVSTSRPCFSVVEVALVVVALVVVVQSLDTGGPWVLVVVEVALVAVMAYVFRRALGASGWFRW